MARTFKSRCYCTNLRRSAGIVSDYYDKALRFSGLNAAQFYLLLSLCRLERANITQWAEQVGLERSTMVRNVRVLEQHGWVQAARQGQGKQLVLTEAGETVLAQAIPRWEKIQWELEKALGWEDAKALLRIAEKLQRLGEFGAQLGSCK